MPEKGSFQPTRCPFVVDIVVDNISEEDFSKESNGINKYDLTDDHIFMIKREYIDVHLTVTIQSMNLTCSNVTSSTVDGDLLRYDQFILKTSNYATVAICLSFLQVVILYRQIQYSTSANTASKMSLVSLGMHSVFDAYLCVLHLIIALYIDVLFYPFISVFLLQLNAFAILDLRLVLLVWKSRHPNDFSSGWETLRRTLTKVYVLFFGGVFGSLFLLYFLRERMKRVIFLMFAFWVPQIVHNIKTGDKFAVQDRFLIGVTLIRLFFPFYAYGYPENFLEYPTNSYLVSGLVVLVCGQVVLLKAQDRYGSRFFIPKSLQPDYYNYHQAFSIDPDDYETCAICMADIISSEDSVSRKVPQVETENIAKNVLTTPCNHRFCEECLVRWMETKMICPTCRRNIPPYNN